jgi:exosortase/archaeosortase family protein
VGFASAITDRVIMSVTGAGATGAVISTFGISAIVWGACWFGLASAARAKFERLRASDWVAAALAGLLFLAPFSILAWVGLSALGLYVATTAQKGSGLRQSGWLFVAITVPMFWSPRFFALFSDSVLSIDAALVATIVGTERVGNTVPLVSGGGFLYIAPGCSSLANVSLAILCWACFAQLSARRLGIVDLLWGVLACTAVVALNVTRIALIGIFPQHYEAIHGDPGYTLASYATLAVTVGICAYWRRRELSGRSQNDPDHPPRAGGHVESLVLRPE